MNKTPKTLIGFLAVSAMLCLALFQTGCQTAPDPIRTTLDLETTEQGLPAFNYASEKDVIYSRTSDGESETVDFKALASAAAFAHAEREVADAEARKAQSEALSAAVQALGANAASVLGAPQPQPQPQPSE